MKGASPLLNQFTSMTNAIKKRELYISTEVPPALYEVKTATRANMAKVDKEDKEGKVKDSNSNIAQKMTRICKANQERE